MEIIRYVSKEDIKLFERDSRLLDLLQVAEEKPKTVFGYVCNIPIKIIIPELPEGDK